MKLIFSGSKHVGGDRGSEREGGEGGLELGSGGGGARIFVPWRGIEGGLGFGRHVERLKKVTRVWWSSWFWWIGAHSYP
ncbi:hypothetical protein Pyn_26651 [Prunus yedoensis var. nudiflora]|uniref:Uncharacterized protein n=1 Tax=Prunus yedoensis var. nudiflora TaxID=2094558 RepID=A0A314XPE6_PRUYE|nr:hypothetical protein Pyn_26651 [Prunus yedoensis var. nudiflora]